MVIVNPTRHAVARHEELRRAPLQEPVEVTHFIAINVNFLKELDWWEDWQSLPVYEAKLVELPGYLFITELLTFTYVVSELAV